MGALHPRVVCRLGRHGNSCDIAISVNIWMASPPSKAGTGTTYSEIPELPCPLDRPGQARSSVPVEAAVMECARPLCQSKHHRSLPC